MPLSNDKANVLILGIGNLLMGDEGVGVHVVRQLQGRTLPDGVKCLDGGTGGFHLLDHMQQAKKIILIDATIDGAPPGSVRRLRPRFSSDYPRTLAAHDIGLKDMLDTLYLLGDPPEIVLYAISIAQLGQPQIGLSREAKTAVQGVVQQVFMEASST